MWGDLSVLAVVPARGGSKGIPRKNLVELGGRSLVARAIDVSLSLDWVDLTVLSTDDEEIASEGRRAGIEVPALRPRELATDRASGYDVWRHALIDAEKRSERQFDISLLLQPPSPFRAAEDVTRCLERLIDGGFEAVTTVSRTPAHFSPEKTLRLAESGSLEPYLSNGFQPTRQLIPDYYHLNGVCYAALRRVVLECETIFESSAGAVVIDRPMVNIDEPEDLELARWLWDRPGHERREAGDSP